MTGPASAPALPSGLSPGGRFDVWSAEPVGWVASDVDGTLLGPDDELTDAVADAMLAVADAGLPVGMVTGRMRQGCARLHDRMPLPGPHVFLNGAEVRMGGATISASTLTAPELDAVAGVVAATDAYCELYTADAYVVNRMDERARMHWTSLGLPPAASGDLATLVAASAPVLKATLIAFDEDEKHRLGDALRTAELSVGLGHSLAHPGAHYLNVTSRGVTKATAMAAAAEHLGITLDNVAMFGDGHNDLPALAAAGTSIAMGQASDDVKELAHLVTDAVTADGVVVALRALGLA